MPNILIYVVVWLRYIKDGNIKQMKTFFLKSISNAINAYLKLDPESAKRLQRLQGKVITIELLPMAFIFQCEFTQQAMTVHPGERMEAQTTIRGTPLQMLGVALTKENRQRFFADDMVIMGNAELAQQVIDLFDHIEIDWEEYLSKFVGDVPAHQFGRLLNNVKSWLSNTEQSFSDNINEYLHEETQCFPPREALQDFYNDIDQLRMDTDRIEARINLLKMSELVRNANSDIEDHS